MCLVGNKKFNFCYLIRDAFNTQVEMLSKDLGITQAREIVKVDLGCISPLVLAPSFWNFSSKLPVA